jgi:hypothetical protein
MGQEVIPDEEDEEDPVIECTFKVKGEGGLGNVELDGEVFAKDGDVEENKGFGFGEGFVGLDGFESFA